MLRLDASRLSDWARRHWLWLLVLASFVASLAVPLLGQSRYGDLSDKFTDHLHHAYATWIFLHHGLEVYVQPISAFWGNTPYAHPNRLWGEMPVVYPPGVFAVFLPPALLGEWIPMTDHAFAVLGVVYVLVLTHLALLAVFMALREVAPGSRLILGAVAWLVLLRLGLQGFYDASWIGCGAMMVLMLRRGRPESALAWFAAAASLHVRAALLAPLAVAAALQVWRGGGATRLRDRRVVLAGFAAAIAIVAFALMYPTTAAFRAAHLTTAPTSSLSWIFAVSLAAAALAGWAGDRVLVATLALSSLIAAHELAGGYAGYWHHGSLMLVAPLVAGVASSGRFVDLLRQASLVWMLVLQTLVWGGSPWELLTLLARDFHPRL